MVFRNGALMCGRLGKSTLGSSKAGLFATLGNDYSPLASATVMGRLAKLAARAMGELGERGGGGHAPVNPNPSA